MIYYFLGGMARFEDCGTPEELMKETYSGLMNYFFGEDRSSKVTKDRFLKVREEVIDDILWLEFTRYCRELPELPNLPSSKFQNPIITDVEFCEHLLTNANIPSKKKKAMVNEHLLYIYEAYKRNLAKIAWLQIKPQVNIL